MTEEKQGPPIARDLFMVALAVVSIAMLIYDEVWDPVGASRNALLALDWMIVTVFALEFVLALKQAPDRRAFWKARWWELPGLVPMAAGEASFLRAFRLLRLVRVVRILRVVSVLSRLRRLNRVAGGFLARSHLLGTLTVTVTLLVGAAYAAWVFERDANPVQFSSFWEGLWWAIVTAATVGYGDKYPITLGGRIVGTFLMFTGVGLIAVLAATFAHAIGRTAAAPAASARFEDRLAQLVVLRERGALTDEEFQAAKRRLLSEQGSNTGVDA